MSKILVVLAAGKGSRFGGDKQLACVGPSGEVLMAYSVYDAIKAGFDKIVFVIRPGMDSSIFSIADAIKLKHPDIEVCLSHQSIDESRFPNRTKPFGTCHALLSAADYIDAPFAVINADDYYGRASFEILAKAMDGLCKPSDGVIIVYPLKNTMSRHGAVTRGICSIKDGRLESVREAFKIKYDSSLGCVELTDNSPVPIDENTAVSMNIWAFSERILTEMQSIFNNFINDLGPDDNKSECLLPDVAQMLIDAGKINVSAFTSECRWFGMTYREDALDTSWELDKRHADGTYPTKLF